MEFHIAPFSGTSRRFPASNHGATKLLLTQGLTIIKLRVIAQQNAWHMQTMSEPSVNVPVVSRGAVVDGYSCQMRKDSWHSLTRSHHKCQKRQQKRRVINLSLLRSRCVSGLRG